VLVFCKNTISPSTVSDSFRFLTPSHQSARLRTAGTMSFRYGRLEVRAKLPRGDWIWPAIWLLPERQVRRTPI
jgi:beta-glucanase (GH16 family)